MIYIFAPKLQKSRNFAVRNTECRGSCTVLLAKLYLSNDKVNNCTHLAERKYIIPFL